MLNAGVSCEMLTPIEAAQLLKVGKRKIYDLCRSGDLPSIKLGARGLRVPVEGIRKLISLNGAPNGVEMAAHG